jgi:sigma-B regulation protein RsbU (phosphoserine phosphatase)
MDTLRFAVAVLVTASGVLSLGFFLSRIRRRDNALLYFGLGAGLYGVRLFLETAGHFGSTADLLITLLLPSLLVLFIAETVGRDWKKAAWWVVAAYLAAAIFGVAMLLAHQSTGFAVTANRVVVLLSIPIFVLAFFPRGPADRDLKILRAGFTIFLLFALYTNLVGIGFISGNPHLEFIGFAVLLGCLGYVALARARRNEERLLALNKELEIARAIQSQLLPPAASVPGLMTASRCVPASSVAGDFYDFLPKDGTLGVLVADVSGHGVPAALSASMVKMAVRSQLDRAGEPAAVLRGMNSILCGNLQGQFVSAGYLVLDPVRGQLHYAGAGHPPLLIWRSRPRQVESLEENGLLLGILPNAGYTEKTVPLENGDRCVLYTDGLLEATCPAGDEFGTERLQNFLAENASLAPSAFCDALVQKLEEWRGEAGAQQDDLTIVAIDCA